MKNITKFFILIIILTGLFISAVKVHAQYTVPADADTGCINSYGQYGTQSNKTECETNPNNKWHVKGTATVIPKEVVPDSECYPGGRPPEDNALIQCGRKISCEYQVIEKDANGNPTKKQIIRIADPDNACKFPDLINLIDRIIQYVLFLLAIPIAAIMFVYAGILLLFSGGDPGAKTKAKGIFFNAVIGLVIAFAAFLIIKLIFSILGYTGAGWIGFD